MGWSRCPSILAFVLALASRPVLAQLSPEDVARLAGEGIRIGSPLGAGGDPQTSVAQPEASAKPSANLNTSIQDQLGDAGDPGGLRAFLKCRGIAYSLTYIGESFGNVTGGSRRDGIYEGLRAIIRY